MRILSDGSSTDIFHFTPEELRKDQSDGHFSIMDTCT